MRLSGNYFKLIVISILIFSLLITNKRDLMRMSQKIAGFNIGQFTKPEIIDLSRVGTIDTLNFCGERAKNCLYIPGRDIDKQIELQGTGYSRDLVPFLKEFTMSIGVNLYYFNTASKPVITLNGTHTDSIEMRALQESIDSIDLIIGMSHGATLAELMAIERQIPAISIGGSIRNMNHAPKMLKSYSNSWPSIIETNSIIYHVIGSRDGQFELYDGDLSNLCIYKGHHYITEEALLCIKDRIIYINESN